MYKRQILQTTSPFLLFTSLNSAAPVEISALPPTIALLGKDPKGIKKACIEPPRPLLKPVTLPNISERTP